MGQLFTLDAGTRSTITDALDDIITEFGRPCRLVYPPRMEACSNCLPLASNKASSNTWKTGGPIPFDKGTICPVCGGSYMRAIEASENIRLKLEWDIKRFQIPVKNMDIRKPYSVVEVKGYVSQIPLLQRCDHIVLDTPMEPSIRYKFKVASEPIMPGNIIQQRYFICLLERAD